MFCLMLRYLLLTLGPSQKICSFGLSEYLGMNIGSCFVHVQFLNVVCIYIIQPFKISSESFFRKKKLMVYEMFQQNASKFAIFLEYENPHSFVPPFSFHFISSHSTLFFPLINAMVYVNYVSRVFSYSKNMANFEAFRWNNSSSINQNPLFLKSGII